MEMLQIFKNGLKIVLLLALSVLIRELFNLSWRWS